MSQKLTLKKKVTFISVYFVLILLIGLLGTEISKIDFKKGPQNRILQKSGGRLIEHHFEGMYIYDDELGWIPKPNSTHTMWGYPIQILEDGIRSNGGVPKSDSKELMMAFGGSFTFGDNVADHETWPAHLEKLFLGTTVYNAGVSSYGLDQSILRAQKLALKYKPDVIVVSSLRASLDRAQTTVRHGAPKPYFLIEDSQLVLKNVPVPFKENTELDAFRKIFGYSYFINKFMDSFYPEYWWRGTMKDFQQAATDYERLAHLLFDRLNQLAEVSGARVILLFQGTKDSTQETIKVFEEFKKYTESNLSHLQICDTTSSLVELKERAPSIYEGYFKIDGNGHMSNEGNYFIARQIKKCLGELE